MSCNNLSTSSSKVAFRWTIRLPLNLISTFCQQVVSLFFSLHQALFLNALWFNNLSIYLGISWLGYLHKKLSSSHTWNYIFWITILFPFIVSWSLGKPSRYGFPFSIRMIKILWKSILGDPLVAPSVTKTYMAPIMKISFSKRLSSFGRSSFLYTNVLVWFHRNMSECNKL